MSRIRPALAALAITIAMTAAIAFAASAFVGKWKTTDSHGKPFTIWLSDDGKAKGDLANNNKGVAGMWKEEGNSAVITWDSGWTPRSPRKAMATRRRRLRTASLPANRPKPPR